MRASRILQLFTLLSVGMACKKNTDFAAVDLKVQATITNDLSGTGLSVPYAAKTLYITRDATLASYLFTATTDANGLATFEGLDRDDTYIVYAYERPADGLHSFDSLKVTVNTDTGVKLLDLRPSGSGQNGFVITVKNAGVEVPSVGVCVSTSPAGVILPGCSASVHNTATDAYGRSFKFNIAEDTYYARLTNPVLNVDTVISFQVSANTIVRPVVELVPHPPQVTGLSVLCTDDAGAPIPQIRICAFASAQLINEDCGLATFQGLSQASGLFTQTGVAPGTYHVRLTNDSLGIELFREYPITQGQLRVDTVVVL